MFGPPPSGPRFPYPYLPVFFPASLLFGHLPGSSLRFLLFSSPPWRSKSPFLSRLSLCVPRKPVPPAPLLSSFSQGHEIPDDRRSVFRSRTSLFPDHGAGIGIASLFSTPAWSVSPGRKRFVEPRSMRSSVPSVPSQAFFLSSSPRNPVRALFRKALFPLCIRPQCVDWQHKLTSSPARMPVGLRIGAKASRII